MHEQDQLQSGETMKSASPNQPQGLVPSRDAGRALDALIAEKVMGWRAWRERRGEYALCVAVPGGAGEPWLRARHPEPERYEAVSCADALRIGFYGTEFPSYSTSIAAAWLVVEKVCPTANVAEPWVKLYTSGGKWLANFHHGAEDVRAVTAPLAICLAALDALDVPHD